MKGLLVKDFRVMIINKMMFIMLIVLSLGYMMLCGGLEKSIVYISFMVIFLITNAAMSSITYDDYDNGMAYLMTLPGAKKIYVYEKYLFIAISMALSYIASILLYVVGVPNELKEGILANTGLTFGVLLIVVINIPLTLKFGAEKGRIYFLMVIGGISAVIYTLSRNKEITKSVMSAFSELNGMSEIFIVLGLLGVGLVLYLVSMLISVGILKNKKF